ncbi:MAG: hypothetical protein HY243_14540 [Proteobacteria bacterium]|nr:hypothetical protein [Pseudomonadota bacterium]
MGRENLIVIAIFSAVVFGATALMTRAGTRRVLAALAGGVCGAALNIGWDVAAAKFGWWHYMVGAGSMAPLIGYVPVAFVYGGAFGLAGWRAMRKWGAAGAIGFFAVYVSWNVFRDYTVSHYSGILVYGPSPLAWIMDAVGSFSVAALVQMVMWPIAGAPKSDALRGED